MSMDWMDRRVAVNGEQIIVQCQYPRIPPFSPLASNIGRSSLQTPTPVHSCTFLSPTFKPPSLSGLVKEMR